MHKQHRCFLLEQKYKNDLLNLCLCLYLYLYFMFTFILKLYLLIYSNNSHFPKCSLFSS